MDNHDSPESSRFVKFTTPSVKWVKQWVTENLVTSGKRQVLKWVNEATLKDIKEKKDPEPEPTTEVLFLCTYEGCGKIFVDGGDLRKHCKIHGERQQHICHYEGCGKTFFDAGALKKHCQIHGEKQYICHFEGCGKKFVEGYKLKRHFLVHTGEKDFICPYEGCGKAFGLAFNLRSHMKRHSPENYYTCPSPGCGKRYVHEHNMKNHIVKMHEKEAEDTFKYIPPAEKQKKTASGRPHVCPLDGCKKAYVYVYKLNLHLRTEHPGQFPDKDANNAQLVGNKKDEFEKQSSSTKAAHLEGSSASPSNPSKMKKPWTAGQEMFEEEDSEETEDERDNDGDDEWRNTETDDEVTEDED